MSELRRGDWMQTFTGNKFYPLDPRPEDIRIQDIAHALAMICRYNGHSAQFYSVAEHSVLVSKGVKRLQEISDPEEQFLGLMHDAAEAYICDIIRPVKRNIIGYEKAELKIMEAIATRFDMIAASKTTLVDKVDNLILYDETKELMGRGCEDWHKKYYPGLGCDIGAWSPLVAEDIFLTTFRTFRPESEWW